MPSKRDCLDCGHCESCIDRSAAHAEEQEGQEEDAPTWDDFARCLDGVIVILGPLVVAAYAVAFLAWLLGRG